MQLGQGERIVLGVHGTGAGDGRRVPGMDDGDGLDMREQSVVHFPGLGGYLDDLISDP